LKKNYPKLALLVTKYNSSSHIEYLGVIPYEQLSKKNINYDALVFSSYVGQWDLFNSSCNIRVIDPLCKLPFTRKFLNTAP